MKKLITSNERNLRIFHQACQRAANHQRNISSIETFTQGTEAFYQKPESLLKHKQGKYYQYAAFLFLKNRIRYIHHLISYATFVKGWPALHGAKMSTYRHRSRYTITNTAYANFPVPRTIYNIVGIIQSVEKKMSGVKPCNSLSSGKHPFCNHRQALVSKPCATKQQMIINNAISDIKENIGDKYKHKSRAKCIRQIYYIILLLCSNRLFISEKWVKSSKGRYKPRGIFCGFAEIVKHYEGLPTLSGPRCFTSVSSCKKVTWSAKPYKAPSKLWDASKSVTVKNL
ncbi:MAG: hypothetical protein JKY13_02100 [Gammaproteobacteria bacterium]|nr:hypothetical protein [Gammaproteobacteria bacterium]